MNRRDLLKQVVAIAAVGAVAPRMLAEPVQVVFGEDAKHAALMAGYHMGVDGADETVVSVTTVERRALLACNWWWYDLHRDEWVAMKVWQRSEEKQSQSYDLTFKLGSREDSSVMMNRATFGHTFTPAAQPQAQGNTPV